MNDRTVFREVEEVEQKVQAVLKQTAEIIRNQQAILSGQTAILAAIADLKNAVVGPPLTPRTNGIIALGTPISQ